VGVVLPGGKTLTGAMIRIAGSDSDCDLNHPQVTKLVWSTAASTGMLAGTVTVNGTVNDLVVYTWGSEFGGVDDAGGRACGAGRPARHGWMRACQNFRVTGTARGRLAASARQTTAVVGPFGGRYSDATEGVLGGVRVRCRQLSRRWRAAACAFIAIQAWTYGSLVADLAHRIPADDFEALGAQPTLLLQLLYLPMGVVSPVGFGALAILHWRRRAMPRTACAVLAVAGLASLLGPFPQPDSSPEPRWHGRHVRLDDLKGPG
jgi:hypothetical protein